MNESNTVEQAFEFIPSYDYVTGKLAGVGIRATDRQPQRGASISINHLHPSDSDLDVDWLGWHLYVDGNSKELSFELRPTDTERLAFVLDELMREEPRRQWNDNDQEAIRKLKTELYAGVQVELVDSLMQVAKEDEEIFLRYLRRRIENLLEAEPDALEIV